MRIDFFGNAILELILFIKNFGNVFCAKILDRVFGVNEEIAFELFFYLSQVTQLGVTQLVVVVGHMIVAHF